MFYTNKKGEMFDQKRQYEILFRNRVSLLECRIALYCDDRKLQEKRRPEFTIIIESGT